MNLFAGVVVGARLAAHRIVELTDDGYIDTLDAVLERLERGLPLADTAVPERDAAQSDRHQM